MQIFGTSKIEMLPWIWEPDNRNQGWVKNVFSEISIEVFVCGFFLNQENKFRFALSESYNGYFLIRTLPFSETPKNRFWPFIKKNYIAGPADFNFTIGFLCLPLPLSQLVSKRTRFGNFLKKKYGKNSICIFEVADFDFTIGFDR